MEKQQPNNRCGRHL